MFRQYFWVKIDKSTVLLYKKMFPLYCGVKRDFSAVLLVKNRQIRNNAV